MASEELAQGEMPTIEIVPNGDMYLLLSDCRLLVSSAIMSISSPIFAKMLNSDFKEGLKNHQRDEKPVILLPDDDAQAITKICQIFHHQVKDTSSVGSSKIKTIAQLSDKYDCVDVVKSWIRLWFHEELEQFDIGKTNDLFHSAYDLDLPNEFSKLTWNLMKEASTAQILSTVISDFNVKDLEASQSFSNH